MNMSQKDRSIAAIIVEKAKPKDRVVNNLEADFEDAKNAVIEEMFEAMEKKDVAQFKSSFKAMLEMCKEEDQYSDLDPSMKD